MLTSITYEIEEFYKAYPHLKNIIDFSKNKKIVDSKLSSLIKGHWYYGQKKKMITHTFYTDTKDITALPSESENKQNYEQQTT